MNIRMNKKYWFSQREFHQFSTIIFHSAEEEFLENQQIIISRSQGYLPLKYFHRVVTQSPNLKKTLTTIGLKSTFAFDFSRLSQEFQFLSAFLSSPRNPRVFKVFSGFSWARWVNLSFYNSSYSRQFYQIFAVLSNSLLSFSSIPDQPMAECVYKYFFIKMQENLICLFQHP